ncbi:uncharacterized protein LOC123405277 [Hordeum vulgare subsp. vulgare]|uniref:uncharacterized protein LOC123405277 n=1 Tax=Hordeum vulgare subsp. vulgare TaxID=112509 RepID=UPI001D1A3CA4|nr:uncharacterized protein LOC123405277 [Hordeum vulgare subsp. vulgare]
MKDGTHLSPLHCVRRHEELISGDTWQGRRIRGHWRAQGSVANRVVVEMVAGEVWFVSEEEVRGRGVPRSSLRTAPPSSAPAPASSPSAASPALLDLNCTATGDDHERQETYPSTHPFSALAGGEDLLCAVGPSSARAGAVDMRWWDLSKKAGRSKRVYLGPRLRALASSGYRVCGVLSSGELHCSWSWGCSVTVQGGNSE